MKERALPGFTTTPKNTSRPCMNVFGPEGTGKTRFGLTLPGPIGVIALDRKTIDTVNMLKDTMDGEIYVNETPYIGERESAKLSLEQDVEKVKAFYVQKLRVVNEAALMLADTPWIESIVMDQMTTYWNWILYSHFGRRNQIQQISRGPANDDIRAFIQAMHHKNLLLLHQSADEYKDTGTKDKYGKSVSVLTGRQKPDGCSKMGYEVNISLELKASPTCPSGDTADKFSCVFRKNQYNPMLEGVDLKEFGLVGEAITWENVLMVSGYSQ